jgi:hypothetical protein
MFSRFLLSLNVIGRIEHFLAADCERLRGSEALILSRDSAKLRKIM